MAIEVYVGESVKKAGLKALIDDEDVFTVFNGRRWFGSKHLDTGMWSITQTVKVDGVERTVALHRLLAGVVDEFGNVLQPDMQVYHRNRDGLDNRKENLVVIPTSQVGRMRGGVSTRRSKKTSSRFKGVSRHSDKSSWRARICVDGKTMQIGSFKNEVDAARAYDKAARQKFGDLAVTNEDLGLYDDEHNAYTT